MSGGAFARDLMEISETLEALGAGEVERIADWTMVSASWGVLRKIRAVWPIDTGLSWGKWAFRKVGTLKYQIYNDALNTVGKKYTGYVYAKGDRARSPIAPGIVTRAIREEQATIADNFIDRLERWISE
jgi:hypothetical protein